MFCIGLLIFFAACGGGSTELAPKEFTDKDLKVHTSDGQVAGYGTKVKVSGKVYYPLAGQDFKCGLENPLIESAR